MKSAELATRWATSSHPKGRANNAYFSGPDFYHYGTLIARRAISVSQAPVALVHDGKFSSGTSKVQGEIRHSAKEAGLLTFEVPHPSERHPENVASFEAKAKEAEDRATRSPKPERYLTQAAEMRAFAQRYREAFGL